MWAQLISMRLEEGSEDELTGLMDALDAVEQPGSGLLRSLTMTERDDPRQVQVLVVFESEEQARAREDDPRRQEALVPVRQKMAEIFEGPPDLHRPHRRRGAVVREMTRSTSHERRCGEGTATWCDDEVTTADRGDTGEGVVVGGRRDPHGSVESGDHAMRVGGRRVGPGGRRSLRRPQPPDGRSLVS